MAVLLFPEVSSSILRLHASLVPVILKKRSFVFENRIIFSWYASVFLKNAEIPHFRAVFLLCISFVYTFWTALCDSNPRSPINRGRLLEFWIRETKKVVCKTQKTREMNPPFFVSTSVILYISPWTTFEAFGWFTRHYGWGVITMEKFLWALVSIKLVQFRLSVSKKQKLVQVELSVSLLVKIGASVSKYDII